jgi:hypothetical protein
MRNGTVELLTLNPTRNSTAELPTPNNMRNGKVELLTLNPTRNTTAELLAPNPMRHGTVELPQTEKRNLRPQTATECSGMLLSDTLGMLEETI